MSPRNAIILILNNNPKTLENRGYIVIILGLSSLVFLINVDNEFLSNSLIIGMSITIILSIISGIFLIIKPSNLFGLLSGIFLFMLGVYDLLITDSWTSGLIFSLLDFTFGFEIFVYSLICLED